MRDERQRTPQRTWRSCTTSAARAAARRLGVRRRAPADARYLSLLAPEIEGRERLREWLADEVLAAPMLEDALGREWVLRNQTRAREGDGLAEDLAVWAAGPVVLSQVLSGLRA